MLIESDECLISCSKHVFLWKVFYSAQLYKKTVLLMEESVSKIFRGEEPEQIWILEHPSVYTLGTGADSSDILNNSFGVPIIYTGRGGKATYHGPGQIVIYIMLSLKKHQFFIKEYILFLEQWIIMALRMLNIQGAVYKDHVGVWVPSVSGLNKIAAIGVRVRRGITYHGIAINWMTNLKYFSGIIACGIQRKDLGVTSILECNKYVQREALVEILKESFCSVFSQYDKSTRY